MKFVTSERGLIHSVSQIDLLIEEWSQFFETPINPVPFTQFSRSYLNNLGERYGKTMYERNRELYTRLIRAIGSMKYDKFVKEFGFVLIITET